MRQETIENYLKTIYHLSADNKAIVGNFKLAEKLNMSYSGAKTRVQRARKLLKEKMQEAYNIRFDAYGNALACGNRLPCGCD